MFADWFCLLHKAKHWNGLLNLYNICYRLLTVVCQIIIGPRFLSVGGHHSSFFDFDQLDHEFKCQQI